MLKQIFKKSTDQTIYNNLLSYYEESEEKPNVNDLWNAYSKDNSLKLKYKYTKSIFPIIVDKLTKDLKSSLTYLPKNLEIYTKPFKLKNGLIATKYSYNTSIQKIIRKFYKRKELFYSDKSIHKLFQNKEKHNLLKENKNKTKKEEYSEYIKSLIKYDKGKISVLEIKYPKQDIGDTFQYYDKFGKLVKTIKPYYYDYKRIPLNVSLVSKETLKKVIHYKINITDLEFYYKFLYGEVLKDPNKTDNPTETKKINKINALRFKRLRNFPIFLIDYKSLSKFYKRIKYTKNTSNCIYYKYCIESYQSSKSKHTNTINFKLKQKQKNYGKIVSFDIKHSRSFTKSKYVKEPNKKHLILYVNNNNLYEIIEKQASDPYDFNYSNTIHLALNKPKFFNKNTLDISNSYNKNTSNLSEEFLNKDKFFNYLLYYGQKNYSLDFYANLPNDIKIQTKANIPNSYFGFRKWKRAKERYFFNKLYHRDKKRTKRNKRTIVVHTNSSLIKYQSDQFNTFCKFFRDYIRDLDLSKKPFLKRLTAKQDYLDYINSNEDLRKYLMKIFQNCYLNIDFKNTKEISFYTTNPTFKEEYTLAFGEQKEKQVKQVKLRDLQISDYIDDQHKYLFKTFKKLFKTMKQIQFNPKASDIPLIPLISKTTYFEKIIKTYNYKKNEYQKAFSLGLISKKEYFSLTNYMKSLVKIFNK